MKKHFNKNLIMTEKEEENFQSPNTFFICEKLIENDNGKVRDHCHIIGKCRGADQWSCNINLQSTKKVPVIFDNLKGYDSHLIFYELKKFDGKTDLITNRLEEYMTFMINKNLAFIGSMQFMNSSIERLVKNSSDGYFKYLTQEFVSKDLGLLKQKAAYPCEYTNSLERFSKTINYLNK